jgi:hypothetical protein
MAFQWVFNNAESISVNKRSVVGQTITRNQTVRAVSRGTSPRRFTVTLPNGMRWTDVATYIQALDTADRFTKETIQINNSAYNGWMSRGDISSSASYSVICVGFPEWTISGRDSVSWSGPFVFLEALV